MKQYLCAGIAIPLAYVLSNKISNKINSPCDLENIPLKDISVLQNIITSEQPFGENYNTLILLGNKENINDIMKKKGCIKSNIQEKILRLRNVDKYNLEILNEKTRNMIININNIAKSECWFFNKKNKSHTGNYELALINKKFLKDLQLCGYGGFYFPLTQLEII